MFVVLEVVYVLLSVNYQMIDREDRHRYDL